MTVAYDREHEAVRRSLLAVSTPWTPCARCGLPLGPDPGRIDLGHRDDGPGWAGLEHRRCNRQAGARKGNARRRARRERITTMVTDVALALEISEDRRHTSVVAAGRLPGGLVVLDLAAYLDGTDPVAAVLELQQQRTVLAVVVDPHSNAATCIRPLEAAGVTVTRPTSGDVAEAHGLFLDELAAGRIRHRGQPELTAAMRHLEQRRLGGASAPERRGALVDVAPAVAAELAVWALATSPEPYDPLLSIY
ncbi:MAG TPA: hypothetical protein VF880_19300 [Actinomycetes bacterium]